MGWDAIADYFIYRPYPIYEYEPPQVKDEEKQEPTEETEASTESQTV